MDAASDRRYTCNRIFRHLVFHGRRGFTGKLEIRALDDAPSWQLYLDSGAPSWAAGGIHPRRRWWRQLQQITGKLPDSERIDFSQSGWDFRQLIHLSRKHLAPQQVRAAISGTYREVLFDIVQEFEQPLADLARQEGPLLQTRHLDGIGDGLLVDVVPEALPYKDHRLPKDWMPAPKTLQQEVFASWARWATLQLWDVPPTTAPVIRAPDQLRAQVSEKTYRNLISLLDGTRTFRDVALKCKPARDLPAIAAALAPHLLSGSLRAEPVGDLDPTGIPALSPTRGSVALCVGGDRAQRRSLSARAREAGYAFETVESGTEALYRLTQPQASLPAVLFVAEAMPLLDGAELCLVLRRLEALQTVPIAIFSRRPRDRHLTERALRAGATGWLSCDDVANSRLGSIFSLGSDRRARLHSRKIAPEEAVETFLEL